tara:strand:- start:447 stop:1013 length:567 start_codon:yes stop_codon:yes gene_type:complete
MPFDQSKRPDFNKYTYSGWKLLEEFDNDAHILDIGCGYNMYKPYCKNLYGIDPYNKEADEMVKFEDYIPHKTFDVFLALGSLNFYDESYVESQIKHLSNMTKKGDLVFWRQNNGDIPHPKGGSLPEEHKDVYFFPWSLEYNKYFTKKYGFEMLDFKEDTGIRLKDGKYPIRYYVKWICRPNYKRSNYG